MLYSAEMAAPRGLEPLTSGVTGRCSNQLSYGTIDWQVWRASNPQPSVLETGAPPVELHT